MAVNLDLRTLDIDVVTRLALRAALQKLGTNKIIVDEQEVCEAFRESGRNLNLFNVVVQVRPDLLHCYEVKMPGLRKYGPSHIEEVGPAQIPYAVQQEEHFRITGESEILVEIEGEN